jgi:hypothetical protein
MFKMESREILNVFSVRGIKDLQLAKICAWGTLRS